MKYDPASGYYKFFCNGYITMSGYQWKKGYNKIPRGKQCVVYEMDHINNVVIMNYLEYFTSVAKVYYFEPRMVSTPDLIKYPDMYWDKKIEGGEVILGNLIYFNYKNFNSPCELRLYLEKEENPIDIELEMSIGRGQVVTPMPTIYDASIVCVVCREEQRRILFRPCNHCVTCIECSETMTECCLCFQKINDKDRIFL